LIFRETLQHPTGAKVAKEKKGGRTERGVYPYWGEHNLKSKKQKGEKKRRSREVKRPGKVRERPRARANMTELPKQKRKGRVAPPLVIMNY